MAKRRKPRRKKPPRDERAPRLIPGYDQVNPESLTPVNFDNPEEALVETKLGLLRALNCRDAVAVLAKTGEQILRELGRQLGPGASGLEQVHAEMLQAFALVAGSGTSVPASPRSMVKIWSLTQANLEAYLQSTAPKPGADDDALLARRVRIRTIYHRNAFSSTDAVDIVPKLLSNMDAASERELGYRLSDLAKAMFQLIDDVAERFRSRIESERALRDQPGPAAEAIIETMLDESDGAKQMWRATQRCHLSSEERSWAGFQMTEMLCAPLFIFSRKDLEERFGVQVSDALFSLSLELGSIGETDVDRIYLANPIWERPFIALDTNTLFLPLPFIFVSFPFTVIEKLMDGNSRLNAAYGKARAQYLEDDIEGIVRESLPSARVHRGVKWKDPDTKVSYEHDVVAILGMQVLIFEAKSGKLSPAARRGGAARLRRDFQELFVKPGIQASRLESLIASRRSDVKLIDSEGEVVRFEAGGPSQVHKFGVCVEQFAGLTGSRRFFKDLGMLERDGIWAPILTLGEIRMISDRLDTEVSFLHYLTRRMTADEVFDFSGDEQDLLSMYLTNRFIVNHEALESRQVLFLNADAAVRGPASPRKDRTIFSVHGPALPPMWNLIAKEIYYAPDRHRFDILITLLNQNPGSLEGIARRLRRWRSGGGTGKGNTLSSRAQIGSRVFVLAFHLARDHPDNAEEWRDQSRHIAYDLHEKLGATDCVVFLKSRRSKSQTFDGVSFFRFPSTPSASTFRRLS